METIEKSVDVDVPVRTAYDQWTQFEEFPNFMEGVQEVRQLDARRLYWRARIAGRDKEWHAEITEQVPDRVIAWRSTSGAPNNGTVWFEPLEGGRRCRIHLRMEYEPQGFRENTADAFGLVNSRVQRDLDRFRDFIQERRTETGAWRGEIHGSQVHRGGNEERPRNEQSPLGGQGLSGSYGQGFGSSYGQGSYRQGQGYSGSYGSSGQGSYTQGSYGQGYGAGWGGQWREGQSASSSDESRRGRHAGKGPKGWQRSDDRVHDDVCQLLTDNPEIDASEVEVEVKDGVVTLRGNVDERRTKWLAEDLVDSRPGVKEVRNELRVNRDRETLRTVRTDVLK